MPLENIENPAALADAGAVFAIYGTNAGLASANNQLFTQSITGNGTSAANEQFGGALASGNFNGPGPLTGNAFADLAIGTPLETVAGATTAGVTNILAGSASRLGATTALASED